VALVAEVSTNVFSKPTPDHIHSLANKLSVKNENEDAGDGEGNEDEKEGM
jgi:hypothetical protein